MLITARNGDNDTSGIPAGASSSRFSKSADTGTRVPRNSHTPLYRCESCSTASQKAQSIIDRHISGSGLARNAVCYRNTNSISDALYCSFCVMPLNARSITRNHCIAHSVNRCNVTRSDIELCYAPRYTAKRWPYNLVNDGLCRDSRAPRRCDAPRPGSGLCMKEIFVFLLLELHAVHGADSSNGA